VLGSLPAQVPASAARPRRRLPRRLAGAAAAAAVLLAGTAVFLAKGSRQEAMAARIGAAVQRANTWHLQGWREDGGKRIPWEVWGRRRPFFYYEQTGEKLLVDNGRERLETFPGMAGASTLAVRMPSRPTPEDNRWAQFTMGTDWRDGRREPWQVTPSEVVFQSTDAGMQGPGSVAHDYFFVDRRTWLPQRWEYRYARGDRETLVKTLRAQYDVPIPPAVATLRLPPAVRVIDAKLAPSGVPKDVYSCSGDGITARLVPAKVDRDGNILLRLQAWLGSERLGVEPDGLGLSSGLPIWARTIDGRRHPWAIVDDAGRPYVMVTELRTGDPQDRNMLRGEQVLRLAPLEPLAKGDPRPREVTLHLLVSVMGTVASPFSGGYARSSFLGSDFQWRLPLPSQPEPIRAEDYRLPAAEARVHYAEDVPLPIRIARERAQAYRCRTDRANAIRWLRWGIDHSAPDSNYAQFMRGDLAAEYHRMGDQDRMAAVWREIVAVKERYPETWGYYAARARQGLAELAKRQPRPR
jgi:hypothetical protein